MRKTLFLYAIGVHLCASLARAQDYGIEFVTVGVPGNPAFTVTNFPEDGNSSSVGRGAVNYECRIGKYEVTAGQWLGFVNMFNDVAREDRPPYFDWAGPDQWGAYADPPRCFWQHWL